MATFAVLGIVLAVGTPIGETLPPPVLECRLPEPPPLCPCCSDLSITTYEEGETTFSDGKLQASIKVVYDDAGEYATVSSGDRDLGGFSGPRLPGPEPSPTPIP